VSSTASNWGEPARRPFTEALNRLRNQGYRLRDLEVGSGYARSTTWFHKLLNNADPWVVSPPTRDALTGLSALVGMPVPELMTMIATEWYGIEETRSDNVDPLARQLGELSSGDRTLLTAVISRLASRPLNGGDIAE